MNFREREPRSLRLYAVYGGFMARPLRSTRQPLKPTGFARAGTRLMCAIHGLQRVAQAKDGKIVLACDCSRGLRPGG
jgi:hypothetical protein